MYPRTHARCVACFANKPYGAASSSFCSAFPLCKTCAANCKPYADCFPKAVLVRSTSGSECARMGRVGNGWCDERESKHDCHIPSGDDAWTCKKGEDAADWVAGGGGCNFACQDSCSAYCIKKYTRGTAEACPLPFPSPRSQSKPHLAHIRDLPLYLLCECILLYHISPKYAK